MPEQNNEQELTQEQVEMQAALDEVMNESNDAQNSQDVDLLKGQIDELKDKYLRLMAEFDNYKRRTSKERISLIETAGRDTMTALLPVLDDFARAKKAADMPGSTEVFSEGVHMVYHKLISTLEQRGLKAMESNGTDFDPEQHEAITEIPAGENMKGKVVDTVECGYTLGERIIRYAKVVVGQ
jgi:molecular chaperone GrpE